MVRSKPLEKERHDGLVLSAMGIGIRFHLLGIRCFHPWCLVWGKKEKEIRGSLVYSIYF